MRVAVILTHPAPYREPVVSELKRRFGSALNVYSLFGEDFGHSDLGLGTENKPLIASKTQNLHGWDALAISCRLVAKLGLFSRFDFVIWPAYAPWWLTIPILIRSLLGRKFAVCLDTTHDAGSWFSKKIKEYIFRKARFLWIPGEASRRYLQTDYSVSDDKIVKGLYLPAFSIGKVAHSNHDKPVFLMVANNLPNRKMHVLATGFKRYLNKGGDGRLILCGKRASDFAGEGIDAIEGIPWPKLPDLYARADVYVHTGNEQYSTALLMGAMIGLPLMASRDVGATVDLFEDGSEDESGLLVDDWCSADAWENGFEQMVGKRVQWPLMGEIARKRAAKFDVVATTAKVITFIA